MHAQPCTSAVIAGKTKADVKARLLNAAVEVVRNEGIHALTQARVSSVAGLRQSHLTYYYPTRKALLTAIAEACAEITVCNMGNIEEADLPPSLAQYFEFVAAKMSDPSLCRILVALTYSSEEDASLKVWMQDFRRRALQRFRKSLQHYGVALTESQLAMFYALVTGLSVVHLSESTEQSARELRRLFLLAAKQLVALAPQAAAPAVRRKKAPAPMPKPNAVCLD